MRLATVKTSSWAPFVAITGCLALAAYLRVRRLSWGLPAGLLILDESIVWRKSLADFAMFGVNFETVIHNRLVYPPLFGYLSGLAVLAGHSLGWLRDNLAANSYEEPILVGRFVSASFGVVAVALTIVLGRRLYDLWTGILAGALLAVAPLAVAQTHYISVDPMLQAVSVAALLSFALLLERPTVGRGFAAGATVAIAVATKYSALALGALPAAILALDWLRKRDTRASLRLLLALALGFLFTLTLVFPAWLRFPSLLFSWVGWYAKLAHDVVAPPTALGPHAHPILYPFTVAMPYALGLAAFLCSTAGVVVALRRRTSGDLLLLSSLALWVAPLINSQLFFLRYIMPTLPILTLFAARAIALLAPRPLLATVIVALTLSLSTAEAVSRLDRFSPDPVYEAVAAAERLRPRSDRPIAVLFPSEGAIAYSWVDHQLRSAKVEPSHFVVQLHDPAYATSQVVRPPDWCDGPAEVLIVPESTVVRVRRNPPPDAALALFEELLAGAGCWRPAARTDAPRMLFEPFYAALDPAPLADQTLGTSGHRLYVRRGTTSPAPGDGAGSSAGGT